MKICVVEDHPIFAEFICRVCRHELAHTIVGQTGSVPEAIQLIGQERPELVVLDLKLHDGDGFEIIEKMPSIARYLAVSAYCDEYTVHRCDKFRVSGFLDKATCSVSALGKAIAAVAAGGVVFSERYRTVWLGLRTNPQAFPRVLSEWEQHIVAAIARGLSDDELAAEFDIAPATAKWHRSTVMRKLGVPSTIKLIARAQALGFTRFR